MKIDLHIHSREGSDGYWRLEEIFAEAGEQRRIRLLSITDHDSIGAQAQARALARSCGITYVTGVELNVTFVHSGYRKGKAISLDFLGYQFDIENTALIAKLAALRDYRKHRADQILENINAVFTKAGLPAFTAADFDAIQADAEGAIGRPHIADYLIRKGLVKTRQEAFDRYLVACDVPKMPLSLTEAAQLIHDAGGKLILAHPGDPSGTSLVPLTAAMPEQLQIIRDGMLEFIDGIECWHSRHDRDTAAAYQAFARDAGLMVTGGSDCHQHPVMMGEVSIPDEVGEQFAL